MLESGFRSAARATAPSIFFACSALYTTTRQLSSEAFGCGPSVSGTAAVPANANANVNANVDANACWHHQDGVRYIWRCHWGVTFLNYTSPLPSPLSLSPSPPLPLSRYPSLHRRIRPRRVAKGIAHRRTCNIVSNRCKAVRWVRRNRALRAVCKYGDVVKGTTRSVACRDCVAQCHAKANKKTTTTARDGVREDFSAHH